MKTYRKTLGALALFSGLAVGYAQTTASANSKSIPKAQAAAAPKPQAVSANHPAPSESSSDYKVADLNTSGPTPGPSPAPAPQEDQGSAQEPESPQAIRFKGITLSPSGSFLAGETVWRSAATGGDLNTSFTGIPLQHSEAAQLTEFVASGRQSRIALKAQGVLNAFTLTGYYEADFLSSGTNSNNNQSDSYSLRQRQVWADARTASGWDFSAGQGWSLVTETTQGLTRGTEILPATIDPQYEAGFVWTRQESFRVSKDFGQSFFLGISAENSQTLNPGGINLPSNLLIGSAGTSGGLYNAASNPTTGTALANYSFNYAPDLIVKAAIQPGWGHWEVFGLQRTFRDRIYPNLSCSSSGIPAITTCTGSTAAAYNDKEIGAGIGGGFRGPLFTNKVSVGLKGLWGQGMGRYGSSTIADVTIRPDGILSPIHGFSALSTIELNPTARLNIYLNYGGDYLDRDYVLNASGTQVGYGNRSAAMSSCNVEPNPGNGGVYQSATPTGAGSSCSGSIKDVQEATAGYWFNFYNGPAGRFRQGIQYSYIVRNLWSGIGGAANPTNGAEGADHMLFTSVRYYLP